MYCLNDNPQPDCDECLESTKLIRDVKYWFQAVLDQIYDKEDFSAEELERYLDEMAGCLDMKLPAAVIAVDREKSESTLLDEWKTFNNKFLNSLNTVGV
jgi:hypothetical protein